MYLSDGKPPLVEIPQCSGSGISNDQIPGICQSLPSLWKAQKCLENENQQSPPQVSFRKGESNHLQFTEQMKKKIDSDQGRADYNKRLGIIEPVFGNITATLKLNQ
jgi:hypothetical protein